jgi:hypothetical protein
VRTRPSYSLCAEFACHLGGESPLPSLMEAKGQRTARAPHREGESEESGEQTRGSRYTNRIRGVGSPGTSGQSTAKSSIHRGPWRRSGDRAWTVDRSTSGDLHRVPESGLREAARPSIAVQKSADGIVGARETGKPKARTVPREGLEWSGQ